ncbi:glycosyltransferase family 2 protein [Akkermansia sp. BIOML-A6]|uniref:glycosyltransferase family 2 protein n=1 Tax=Akkermansia sp. BIOML-A6 TaxID=2584562 RepID=UPI00122EAB86|nr:glycosyltransferase family A protein [Akkermansia sp. BIOML-A6]KAA3295386.1 glycosyltransferase family 2 protein [Akkermansia sp. BIOML-A6]
MTPFFSIVIPAYNVELYLQETLDSVYAQTFDKYEIIVVDDGSTDGTPEMLARQNDPRLRVIRQQNAGVSAARNTGIAAAQGTFIAFLDGDDIWAPWHLEHACHFFEEHPEVHWYASPFLRSDCVKESLAGLEPDPGYDVVDYFSGNAWVCSSTAILAKKAIPGKELFPTDMAYGEDVLAWLSFALQSPLIGMGRKADCIYRFHASSAVATRAADINTEIVSSRGPMRNGTLYMKKEGWTKPCHSAANILSVNGYAVFI